MREGDSARALHVSEISHRVYSPGKEWILFGVSEVACGSVMMIYRRDAG